jgi:MFS transporter, SP family, solute carrier family 2 (myo-inositol transporter), member 13
MPARVPGKPEEELEMRTLRDDGDDSPDAPLIQDEHRHRNEPTFVASTSGGNFFLWALTISACVSGLLFGYDTGVISSTLVSIGSDLSSRPLTTVDKSLITSCTSLFALIASPIAGLLADRVGRKNVILFADALFTGGALWQAVTTSVWGMILGRSVVGLAIGAASLIVPLYISELSPGHLRGRLVTVSLLFITGGQVIAYIVGWAFSTMNGGWRWMVGIGAFPAITQIAMLSFMPETPRFLAAVNREDMARQILKKVYKSSAHSTSDEVDHILGAIKQEIHEEEEAKQRVKHGGHVSILPPLLSSLLFHPPHARALTIACLLQALQQLCGFNSLMYFSATIFSMLQFASPTLTSLSIATTNFVFTIAAFYLIDRVGRRKILLITIPIMVLALLLCALAFMFVHLPKNAANLDPTTIARPASSLPALGVLASLLLYVCPYATGLGPVPWQQSELFPLSVRSLGSSIATSTNWGCNTLVGLTFLPMMELLTPGWTFVTYAVVCAVGWVAVWCIYPETAGLELEDVGKLLQNGWGVQESMKKVP